VSKEINYIINKLRREKRTPEQKRKQAEAQKKWQLANEHQVKKIWRDYYVKNREVILAKRKASALKKKQSNEYS
jgi:hypothetical protein